MKKIIVTGGLGFIGSNLINLLTQKKNFKVLNIDKVSYSSNFLSIKKKKNYYFEKIDLINKKKVKELIQNFKPDYIFNLAAESHVDRSIDNPSPFIYSNIEGTFNLLEGIRSYLSLKNKKSFKLIHVSTDEVYGDLKFNSKKFTEKNAYNPKSPYSASKASSDHIVSAWNKTFDLPAIITNCGNNFGFFQHPEKLIPHTILSAINKKKIPIYGNGKNIRDWIFVEDHIEALFMLLEKGKVGEKYNIGSNNEISNINIVKLICENLDKIRPEKNFKYEKLISFVKDRPSHDFRYALNTDKIANQIFWTPKYDFLSSLALTIKWYLNNYVKWKKGLSKSYNLGRIGLNIK